MPCSGGLEEVPRVGVKEATDFADSPPEGVSIGLRSARRSTIDSRRSNATTTTTVASAPGIAEDAAGHRHRGTDRGARRAGGQATSWYYQGQSRGRALRTNEAEWMDTLLESSTPLE